MEFCSKMVFLIINKDIDIFIFVIFGTILVGENVKA